MAEKVKTETNKNKYEQIYRERTRKVETKAIGYLNGHIFTY